MNMAGFVGKPLVKSLSGPARESFPTDVWGLYAHDSQPSEDLNIITACESNIY